MVTEPDIASFSVSGDLSLRGTGDEVEAWTFQSTQESPQVWKYIYQESMNVLAMLTKMIEVPFPVPNIGGVTIDY